jgi:PHD/YefM family antitoxin component YafN of YafNO toxin-antitoxin module
MELLYTNASVSISELKKNPAACLVPVAAFEAMMEKLEDFELANQVKARANERTVKVYPDVL